MTGSAVEPQTQKKRRLSPIWLIPFLALCIAVWVGWQAWNDRGIHITLLFENGSGIKAGHTQVLYNGLQVGRVSKVSMEASLIGVRAQIDMNREFADWLGKKSQFWLVKPEVSLAGVSGIETLLSGNYITLRPDKGELVKEFRALSEAPPLAEGKRGLHISLDADDVGSLVPGSPVYSRHIPVGEVERVTLKDNGKAVQIDMYIEPEYASLVRKNSRFWNVSGIKVSAPMAHFKVETESFLAILKGGVAFSTPDWKARGEPSKSGDHFKLFSDYDTAKGGIPIDIDFPLVAHIVQTGARVVFHGIDVGLIQDSMINDSLSGFTVRVCMNPQAAPTLVEGARFWLVEPRLSVHGLQGMDALFSGRYIAMDVTEDAIKRAQSTRKFQGALEQPPAGKDTPGLHLTLKADSTGGISRGSGIWLRGTQVGSVQNVVLNEEGVDIDILVEPKYHHFFRQGMRFWRMSGVAVTGNLSKFTVESRPLSAIIGGGINCDSPEAAMAFDQDGKRVTKNKPARLLKNSEIFALYNDRGEAFLEGKYIRLFSGRLSSAQPGSPVLYHGVQVGAVSSTRLADPADRVEITLLIQSRYVPLVTEESRFWNVGGLDVNINVLSGINVRTPSMTTLFEGGIAFATPAISPPCPDTASFMLHDRPSDEWIHWNPAISLMTQ